MSKSYWKWKAKGICYICQTRPLWGTHVTCDECAKAQRLKQQNRVDEAKATGKCTKCFKEPQSETSTLCLVCLTRTQRLKEPTTREQELTQQPLRRWQGHSKANAFGREGDPEQMCLADAARPPS